MGIINNVAATLTFNRFHLLRRNITLSLQDVRFSWH